MPRTIIESAKSAPTGQEPLPPGFSWSGVTVGQPDFSGETSQPDARAVTNEGWGATPIEGTFSIVGPHDFELTLVEELHDRMRRLGFGAVRAQFAELEAAIAAEPHGPTSIDHFKDTDAGRYARTVHAVTGPLAELLPNKTLALKGTGLDMARVPGNVPRAKLVDQFRVTLEAARRQRDMAPDGIGGVVFVNDVYGVLRYRRSSDERPQEWMLMERVTDAEPVPNLSLATARLGSGPSIAYGFDVARDPALAGLVYRGQFAPPYERFSSLADTIARELDYPSFDSPFSDLNGNNILRQDTAEGPRYTIIDVQSH